MKMIHINQGGAFYRLTIGAKPFYFEDHPYLGPMLTTKRGEPLDDQPDDEHLFHVHYDAWRSQGKKFFISGGENWCEYKTRTQKLRAAYKQRQGK